jgi:hypothetical protein
MIKSYYDYINENKLFIYHRQFRVADLLETTIYPKRLIKRWMKQYNFDEYAHCLFVTEKPSTTPTKLRMLVPLSSRDIKNKTSFNTESKKYEGWMPEDSKIEQEGSEVYLYIFKKNSNPQNRARQLHGFIYEGEVKRLNGLSKLKKTHKWDAEGGMDQSYLNHRISHGKKVEFFDGTSYQPVIKKDEISGIDELDVSIVPENFFDYRNWSIKCMKNRTDIELGDFKRISGIEKEGNKIKILDSNEETFMFAVSFHDGSDEKKILEEYIIVMPVSKWKTYLPDIKAKISDVTNMYNDLAQHKLKGQRTVSSELAWQTYMDKYKTICDGSSLRLRFKRDTKGQLRIQCSFSYNVFKTLVLKNPHIKIS